MEWGQKANYPPQQPPQHRTDVDESRQALNRRCPQSNQGETSSKCRCENDRGCVFPSEDTRGTPTAGYGTRGHDRYRRALRRIRNFEKPSTNRASTQYMLKGALDMARPILAPLLADIKFASGVVGGVRAHPAQATARGARGRWSAFEGGERHEGVSLMEDVDGTLERPMDIPSFDEPPGGLQRACQVARDAVS
ncbi:hypothetical protein CSOJ01_10126 [Colletotrichum sojae]|uniref:Uncharacterized protein n=1 Tax=Colletotrichum sojae TaxID=2175907 RepID=A0A8H6MPL5_9PEZI|nr:hypothetical protein CSOJ01_10126 [Colletotrichum sojae]